MNKKVLFLVFMLSRAVGLFAVEAVIDGLLYDITMESKEAKVIKYKNDIHYSGDIVIPETIEYEGASYIVTKIGHGAFSYCRVNTVTIPKSITCIEDSAFCCSRQISSINIPQSVASIGDGAFYDCKKLNSVHISDLEVWCSVEFQGYLSNPLTIAHHLFMNGEEIKDLVIPNTVTSIGKNAFSGCSELKSITIPNGVTIIGEGSFSWCTGLTSIKIPNSVTIIGDIAFSGCQSLTAIDIPNSVESIGYGAFDECRGLTTITIPNSVKKIGNGAFSHCI